MVLPLLFALISGLIVSVVARKIFFPDGPPWEDQGDGFAKYVFSAHSLLHAWIIQNMADDNLDMAEAAKGVFCVYGPVVIGLLVYWLAWRHGLP